MPSSCNPRFGAARRGHALRTAFLALGLAMPGVAQEPQPLPNLLPNPSFTDVGPGVDPVGWRRITWSGSAEFAVDDGGGRDGGRCVRIRSVDGADASFGADVRVRPHTRYRLRAWIRTAGLEPGSGYGALCNLHELSRDRRTPAVVGDADWTLVESTFDSGERERLLVNLLFGGYGRSTGTAWFDDVELVDLTPPPPVLDEEGRRAWYREHVAPLLAAHCFECHGPDSPLEGGLYLGAHAGVVRGGASGPALDDANPEHSLLLRAVRREGLEMPPEHPLDAAVVATFETWVRLGAPFDPALEAPRPKVAPRAPTPSIEAGRAHWAFRTVERPAVPQVADPTWAANPIDAFVFAALAERGLQPSPRASRATLIRRAYHALLGLPPSPEEVRAFVADERPDAFAQLVDRLLASPHYGERWGRHWLDVVRYAETNSFERDGQKPFAWRYRDWVVQAFNDDLPYDRFVLEQLAGDELPDRSASSVVATGYYRLGLWDDEPADPELARYDELDDIVATTAQTFLGLTMNCARCHDHKLDPIPQVDYYRMLGWFAGVRRYGERSHESVLDASVTVIADADAQARHAAEVAAYDADRARVDARLTAIEALVRPTFAPVDVEEFAHEPRRVPIVAKRVGTAIDQSTADEYAALTRERDALRANPPRALAQALCVKESGTVAPEVHVLMRGNPHVPGRRVAPGLPEVLGATAPRIVPPVDRASTGRRLALARWIADPANPLTARVFVNRVWHHHFGRGIVATTSNFGLKGAAPTHPELLDWLAAEFAASGFRIKALQRTILLSRTWQQDFRHDARAETVDPANELLWRADPQRVSAEELRDAILAVSGDLDLRVGGPSVFPVIPAEVLAGQSRPGDGWPVSRPEDRTRRSIYVHVKRSMLLPLLATFDAADTDFTCPERFQTTQPTQALSLLNSEFANEQARRFAAAVQREHPAAPRAQVERALSRAMQRAPTAVEVDRGMQLVAELQADEGYDADAALARLCLVALNLDEFLYVR